MELPNLLCGQPKSHSIIKADYLAKNPHLKSCLPQVFFLDILRSDVLSPMTDSTYHYVNLDEIDLCPMLLTCYFYFQMINANVLHRLSLNGEGGRSRDDVPIDD